jgi:AraC-like DNA-binding protein
MGAAPIALLRTLSVDIVRILLEDNALGAPVRALCGRLGMSDDLIANVAARIPAGLLARVWDELPRLTGDACSGLHLGERTAARSLPFAARIFESCATVGDGIERLLALQSAVNHVHVARFTVRGSMGVFRVETRDTPLPAPAHAMEFAFAWMVGVARRATGVHVCPSVVRFEHVAEGDGREQRRVFGCPVEFGAAANEVVFSAAALALPHAHPDPALIEILETYAKLLLSGGPETPTFRARVGDALVPLLASGPTVGRVADALHVSARSVQRYLQNEGTTFAAVLDEVRRSHAETALRDPRRSIAEVSARLGFADQSTFHRAFVRWTGTTPGAYRRSSAGA